MFISAAAGLLAASMWVQQTDTTFTVDPRHRLDVSNYSGEIIVRTWSQNAVRIVADHSRRDEILVDRSSSEIRVRAGWWQPYADEFQLDIESDRIGVRMRNPRRPSMVDYEITVPRSMPLVIGGPRTDVTIDGTEGEVSVAVNEGDVRIVGGRGRIAVRSIEGDVWLENVDGRSRVIAIEGDITVLRAAGEIVAESTDGDIVMDDMRTTAVEVLSVDGDIQYEGIIDPTGLYVFSTHDGDVTVTIPRDANTRVSVATFDGEFRTDFAVRLPRRREGRRFSFTLGEGAAQIEIEAFDGDIELRTLDRSGRRSR